MSEQKRTRCEGCERMCLPNEISDVPDESRMLCEDCARAEGFSIEHAASGAFSIFPQEPDADKATAAADLEPHGA